MLLPENTLCYRLSENAGVRLYLSVQSGVMCPIEVLVPPLVALGSLGSSLSHSCLLGLRVAGVAPHLGSVFCSSLVFISCKVKRCDSQIWHLNTGKIKGSFQQLWGCKAAP